jgi:hypothetical protein
MRLWRDDSGRGISLERQLLTLDQADEHARHGELKPYLGSHVGWGGCKSNGLIRKTIRFTLGGQDWGLVAYYTMADVVAGNLVRPRSDPAIAQQLLSRELNPEFWQQAVPGRPYRHTTVTMVDDNNAGTVSDWHLWYRPPKVKSPPPLEARPAASPEDSSSSTIAESVPAEEEKEEEEEQEEGGPPIADFFADYFDLDAFFPDPDAMDDNGMDDLLAEMLDAWDQQQHAQQQEGREQQLTAHQDQNYNNPPLGLVPGQPGNDEGPGPGLWDWGQLIHAGGSDGLAPPVADPVDDQNGEDSVTSLLPQDLEGLSAFLDRLIESGEVVLPDTT